MPDREFLLKPSKYYLFLLAILLVFSGLIVLFVSINLLLKIAFLFALVVYGKYLYQYAVLQHPKAILSFKLLEDAKWLLQTKKGSHYATLDGSSTVTTLCSILRFKLDNRQIMSTIIFSDSLAEPAAYRHLLKVVFSF